MDEALYNAALAMLTRRDHSEKELKQKLCARFSPSVQELTLLVEALKSSNYLDDQRFADMYTRARMRKGFGPERIKLELRERGVADSSIREAIQSHEAAWFECAHSVWQKKFRSQPENMKERARQGNFLRYRGFSSQQVTDLFNESR